MIFDIIELDELISMKGLEFVLDAIDGYEGRSVDLFLKDKAIDFSKRDLSKTYLAVDGNDSVLGYFTIGIKCFRLSSDECDLPSRFYKLMNPYKGVVQSYLIGQLSRSKNSEKGFGQSMLDYAIDILNSHRKGIGCKVIHLDCVDSLTGYYEKNGFTKVKKDSDTGLNNMVMILS